jgi:hypothetical protein
MSNNKDFKIKNGIKSTVYHEAVGTVVSGAVGYDIAGASYDSKSFTPSPTINSIGVAFKPDGTKMYTLDLSGDDVAQYSLTSAWDVSTATSDSKTFDVGSQDTDPYEVEFKSDGTKMYILGTANDTLYQYSLSTAWDVSTASYDSVSFSFTSQTLQPYGMSFSSDGTKLYVADYQNKQILQYNLSTAWDASTISYASKVLSVSTELGSAQLYSVSISSNGTKLYVGTHNQGMIYEYILSTAYDVSTGSYTNNSFSSIGQEASVTSIVFKPDGTKMFVTGFNSDTIYQYSTVLTTAQLDLSTGSVFDYTPASDVQVTLTNPATSGTSSGATLLLTGPSDSIGVSSTFSTTLWAGNNGSQTITNGIDLLNEGGLVWFKNRTTGNLEHKLVDTERGLVGGGSGPANAYYLQSDTTNAQGDRAWAWSFLENGFSFNKDYTDINATGEDYVSWTFKKQTKFFDVQTFTTTYNNDPNVISHDLDVDLGCAIFKQTGSGTQGVNWIVYHRSLGLNKYLVLNSTASEVADNNSFEAVDNSAGTISVGYPVSDSASRMVSGGQETSYWVGYFFAHNDGDGGFGPDADQDIIKCGSYTGNGSSTGPVINLGFEPQWLLIKRATGTANWFLVDTKRGLPVGSNSNALFPNNSNAEDTNAAAIDVLPTGFQPKAGSIYINSSSDTYIYVAIRGESIPTITYDSALQWSGGTAPTAPAIGETDVITFNTTDGGTTYKSALALDGAK